MQLNETHDGWVFFHGEVEEHHEREMLIEAAIVGQYQSIVDNAVLDLHKSEQSNVLTARKAVLYDLLAFRDTWIDKARQAEQNQWISQHVREDNPHLHPVVIRSLNDAIETWKRDSASRWSRIDYQIETTLKPRVTALHPYETRWAQAARLKAEAETETESEGE